MGRARVSSGGSPLDLPGLADRVERLRSIVDRDLEAPARWRGPLRREFTRGTAAPVERDAVARAFDELIARPPARLTLGPREVTDLHLSIGGEGMWRTCGVRVGPPDLPPERVPPPDLVPPLVAEALERAFGTGEPAALASARLHLDLLRIHPFADGNGRVARLAASAVLLRAGYRSTLLTAVEQHFRADPIAYPLAFRTLRAGGFVDADVWLATSLEAAVARATFAAWWKRGGALTGPRMRWWRRRHPRNAAELERQLRRLSAEEAEDRARADAARTPGPTPRAPEPVPV